MISFVILIIIFSAIICNKNNQLYDLLLEGITTGIKQVMKLLSSIITITIGVEVFINSGIIELIDKIMPFSKIPPEIFLQLIIKPVSYNSSLVIMTNIMNKYGANSLFSYLSNLIQGAFDTTIFVCVLYFNELKNTYFKHVLNNALLINLLSVLFASLLWLLIF